MEKISFFLKNNFWKVTSILFFILFIGKGCTLNKINTLDKKYSKNTLILSNKIDSLNAIILNFATEKQVRDQMEKTMLDFLIYEDDLDKGKTSLSEIKNKIEKND